MKRFVFLCGLAAAAAAAAHHHFYTTGDSARLTAMAHTLVGYTGTVHTAVWQPTGLHTG